LRGAVCQRIRGKGNGVKIAAALAIAGTGALAAQQGYKAGQSQVESAKTAINNTARSIVKGATIAGAVTGLAGAGAVGLAVNHSKNKAVGEAIANGKKETVETMIAYGKDIIELEKVKKSQAEEIERHKAEIEAYKAKVGEKSTDINSIEDEIDRLNAQLNQAKRQNKDVSALRRQIETLKSIRNDNIN
jgi:predicted RNase H-like nuclease (RuvC/YqgF family)